MNGGAPESPAAETLDYSVAGLLVRITPVNESFHTFCRDFLAGGDGRFAIFVSFFAAFESLLGAVQLLAGSGQLFHIFFSQ